MHASRIRLIPRKRLDVKAKRGIANHDGGALLIRTKTSLRSRRHSQPLLAYSTAGMTETVEKALRHLQHVAREPAPAEGRFPVAHMSFKCPADLEADGWVVLADEGVRAFEQVCSLLGQDLRFEYMTKSKREEATRAFAAFAIVRRSENHVPAFVDRHAYDPMDMTCSFPVEYLSVPTRREIAGAILISPSDADPPELSDLDAPRIDSVISVPCRGTSGYSMMMRSRTAAGHALRLLRAALRENRRISDTQLRFRLGVHYWLSDDERRLPGWHRRADDPRELALPANSSIQLLHLLLQDYLCLAKQMSSSARIERFGGGSAHSLRPIPRAASWMFLACIQI